MYLAPHPRRSTKMKSILISALLITSVFSQELPRDYEFLRNARDKSISNINRKYITHLKKLKTKYTKLGKLEIALLIDEEITRYENNNAKSYVSNVRGFAGLPGLTRNNIYSFDIEEVGNSASVTFWASFDMDLKGRTNGTVYLIDDEGRQKKIHRWKDSDFKISANSVRSYADLKPYTIDISDFVKKSGRYKIRFTYTGGSKGLSILRVSLNINK